MSFWLPTMLVIIETAIALTWANSPPAAAIGRRTWLASLLVFGSLAIAATVWQGRQQIDDGVAVTGATVSSRAYAGPANQLLNSELSKQIKTLEARVRELEKEQQSRTIPPETADQFSAYLKQYGTHQVVVSCTPDDLEAYHYANQLVNVLKAGDWDATGPEITKIFGSPRAPGINVYANSDDNSDTEKILLDGFAKFNIPYQTKVTPSQAISDPKTVELFIGKAQFQQDSASGD
jgi:hypothetical protein